MGQPYWADWYPSGGGYYRGRTSAPSCSIAASPPNLTSWVSKMPLIARAWQPNDLFYFFTKRKFACCTLPGRGSIVRLTSSRLNAGPFGKTRCGTSETWSASVLMVANKMLAERRSAC